MEGTKEAEILPEIDYTEDQILIKKTRQSIFIRTCFEEDLRQREIDTLIICGVFTHGCVGRTAIDAYQRDFQVVVAREASFSDKPQQEEVMFEVITEEQEQRVLTNREIKEII
ncbi:MAG: isochorismatase family cysteine hydrolase [Halanaerobium sp.]|nr:isochorismatase family cysteine hydrolase [Halanaerobium sp.]